MQLSRTLLETQRFYDIGKREKRVRRGQQSTGQSLKAQNKFELKDGVVSDSRPTAVNLEDAAKKLTAIATTEAATPGATSRSVTKAVIFAADAMYDEDVAANKVGF
jgi:methylthioribose-1-phosphate isomerase